jgi:hypothetical protein
MILCAEVKGSYQIGSVFQIINGTVVSAIMAFAYEVSCGIEEPLNKNKK